MEKIFLSIFKPESVTLILNANTSPVNKFSNYCPFYISNEKYNLNNTLMEKIFPYLWKDHDSFESVE